jgi:type I restriction-modification system DNA methylase subunit
VRKFNEDNNEEAGEHWTPRDAVRLMANLVFLRIEPESKSSTYPPDKQEKATETVWEQAALLSSEWAMA